MPNAQPRQTLSRRRFLRLSAATAATLTTFPAIIPASVRASATAPSNRINFGFVGCGSMGIVNLENVASGLASKGAFVRAVCDVDKYRLNKAAQLVNKANGTKDCLCFNDFRDITRRDDIDAVVISTPDHWHALNALDAVRHKKDIYLEKPLTLTLAEGKLLVAEARKHGRIGQTGTIQRSSRFFRHACELVRNGRIGKISRVNVFIPTNKRHCSATWREEPIPAGFDYDLWLGPAPYAPFTRQRTHYQFRYILDYANGQTTNFGAHDVDICQWALGRDDSGPTSFHGAGDFPSTGLFTSPTIIDFSARYDDGIEMTLSNRGGKENCLVFHGEKGWLEASRRGLKSSKPSIVKEKIGPGEIRLYESNHHMGNFLDCVRTRRHPVSDIAICHRSTSICNIGMIAMQLRRPLQWDPAREEFVNDSVANRMRERTLRGPWSLNA